MNAIWIMLGALSGAAAAGALLGARLRAVGLQRRLADQRASELERELVRAQAGLEHERELSGERLATLKEAQEQLSNSFKALSAEALQA